MSEYLTLEQRRARGETIVNKRGVEVVHGRVMAREALADYEALLKESDHVWHTVSPYRSDHDEINAAIDRDLLAAAGELAYAIRQWIEDEEWEATEREYAIDRMAEAS